METPAVEKIVEIELLKLKNENQLVLDDNLTPFSLKVRNEMNKDQFLFDSPLKKEMNKSSTLDALNLELIEFPKFKEVKKVRSSKIGFKSKQKEVADTTNDDVVNTSADSSDVALDNLEIGDSPIASKQAGYEEMNLLKMFDSKIENADISLEEFPLYEFQPMNNQVIDNEELLKPLDNDPAVEAEDSNTVARRTRHKAKASSPRKQSVEQPKALQKSKSKIPLPTSVTDNIRRSKRLEPPISAESPTKKRCSPIKKFNLNLKPVLRMKSQNSLNLIVDSSTGQLHEATQYATEINANNGEGIPLPKAVNEQVTIPINGVRRSKIPKTAIVRGFNLYKIPNTKHSGKNNILGFYSEDAYKKYFSPNVSPNKVMKPNTSVNISQSSPSKKTSTVKKKRSVRWAEQLEW